MEKIIYISQGKSPEEHISGIQKVLDAGVKWVQLRLKSIDIEEVEEIAAICKDMTLKYNAQLFLNDYVQVAKKLNINGLHVGKEDLPINKARKIVGEKCIIGGTANTFEDIFLHAKNGANYIGLGPYQFTSTKEKLSPVLGINGYETILAQCKENLINLPIFAIGGIQLEDIVSIFKTGIDGVALSGLLFNAPNAEKIVKEFNKIGEKYVTNS